MISLEELLDAVKQSTQEANDALDRALAAMDETAARLAQIDDQRDQVVEELRAEIGEEQLAILRARLRARFNLLGEDTGHDD